MTKDQVIEQMREALEVMQFRLRPEGVDDLPHIREALLVRINHALAAAKAVRCEHCDGTGDVHSPDGEWRGQCPCIAKAVEPERKPLTPDQIDKGQWDDGTSCTVEFYEGVRFAEKHHGITSETGGQQ